MKLKFHPYIFSVVGLVLHLFAQGQVRSVVDFNKDWKFHLGNDSLASNTAFDDSRWRKLDLPHDWSIESDFKKDAPATTQGGALPGGIGWYRKTFVLPPSPRNKRVLIEFDGIYKNSEVWINGHYLGKRPYGYSAFSYDLTEHLFPSPQKNIIVVKVDNSQQPDSRWYTGSGIYRDVKLSIMDFLFVDRHNIFITTPVITKDLAIINITGTLVAEFTHIDRGRLRVSVYLPEGEMIFSEAGKNGFYVSVGKFTQKVKIIKPKLWSPDRPYLYKVKIEMLDHLGDVFAVEYISSFGIRFFNFDSEKGFFLNNQPLKIKGVCMHHDLGALGSAFNITAAKRQLKILKEMGCNAIRFSHNPPASELLDLCDQMGFLVIDEAFDMWQKRKNKYDYHLDFKEWHKKDIEAMVLRDRNHPSVFMWSIGNEIREQFDSTGIELTKELVAIIRSMDNTRPVTSALTENFSGKNFIYQSGVLDVLGFNYKLNDYKDLPARFSGQKFLATETASALATRGVYDLPSDSMRIWPPDPKQPFTNGNPDMTVSSYDNAYAYWGASHERSWLATKNYDFIAGCFVWCGFDFLGEPVPYPWPARSSYYGIVDLAGFPKDIYYMYQSEWTNQPVLHIFPHWNWKRGQVVDIWAYYNNADEVELFLNGRSLGKRKKNDSILHVMWQAPFEAGTLKAVSRKNGKIILTKEIKTVGKPARIELIADKTNLKADGKDLSFITVRILDKKGNLVPYADNLVEFSIAGNGIIAGTDNGYQADTISLKSNKRKCWKGMALAIIQSTEKKGNITLTTSSPDLASAMLTLRNN